MIEADYKVKFNQLSHYSLFLVATDREKCRMFKEGIKYKIRKSEL